MSPQLPEHELLDLLYGDLSPVDAAELRARLDADPELRARFKELTDHRALINQHSAPPAQVPPELTARILEDARAHAPAPRRGPRDPRASLWRRTWHIPGLRQGLVAAALLLGIAGILRTLHLDAPRQGTDPHAELGRAASSPTEFQHGQLAPASPKKEAAADSLKASLPAEEHEAPEADPRAEIAEIAEITEAAPAANLAEQKPREPAPAQRKRRAPASTTADRSGPSPARKALAEPSLAPSRPAEPALPTTLDELVESDATPRAKAPAAAARTRSRTTAAPMTEGMTGFGRGGGGIGTRRDAPAERELATAPSLGAAPQAEQAPPSAAIEDNLVAPAEAADDEFSFAPAASALQRAERARANANPEQTLQEATSALQSETSPERRARAYDLIAWAHDELNNPQAARNARQQAEELRKTSDR
ncbi:hypothetical protein DL240_06865 [Lujinxingia litoralis]|uniref:Zinc-finger domain-containing protein n=1 Tax=Lujinxingia litoralis TaxID=2211119 RepID=A0A328CA46_9DELT|nr:hypothetical protein [Lujinxingia litoralis]RAL23864.1 hypothetical protein DL240_06865 [Lujinxingia litoralis]